MVFREILDGEYARKLILTEVEIQPFAFPDVSVAVELLTAKIIDSLFYLFKPQSCVD